MREQHRSPEPGPALWPRRNLRHVYQVIGNERQEAQQRVATAGRNAAMHRCQRFAGDHIPGRITHACAAARVCKQARICSGSTGNGIAA